MTKINDGRVLISIDHGMITNLSGYATRNVPRYTSYPTAPHFGGDVTETDYAAWLAALDPGARLSVYLHVPYCRSICHYCGCHTKAVLRPQPVADYAKTLRDEIGLAAGYLDIGGPEGGRPVVHLHWGGGTPSLLSPRDFKAIVATLRDRFDVLAGAEHAIELDPRTVTPELVETLAATGVNRASLGVQDFNAAVQAAIGRIQPFELVARVVGDLRAAGIGAINMDLMYGLPHQAGADVERTVDLTAELRPARIALFGYAHVPWMKTHQRLIDAAALPGATERLEQADVAANRLITHGYVRVGIDHFALPDDPLAIACGNGTLRRNFQGYTTDPADALIGFGVSSIGKLPQGYVQNAPDIGGWRRAIQTGCLPVVRGKALSADDNARAEIIERLMCDFEVDADAVLARHGLDPDGLADSHAALEPLIADGLAERQDSVIRVPAPMRAFVRLAASAFDAYLPGGAARHSVAV